MGKRRNTAKTGDRAIYKSRASVNQADHAATKDGDVDDDDPMYSKVDRFHNKRDEEFLKLDGNQSGSESEEEKEAVMDLGIGGENSTSEESDSSEEEVGREGEQDDESSSEDEEEGADLSESENEDFEVEDVRDWGKKKASYYHGDTADLEIGQDEEDAFLEEEAAREVQAARYKDMNEKDFLMSDDEGNQDETAGAVENLTSVRNIAKLTAKDRQKILDKQHPELLPLLSYFSEMVKELDETTIVATKAIFEGEDGTAEAVGTTKPGKRYLLTKALLQTSTALNLAMYLLLKSDQVSKEVDSTLIQSHPVMTRLQKLNGMKQTFDGRVETQVSGLTEQLLNLVKAVELMKAGGIDDDVIEESEDSGSSEVVNDDGNAEENRTTDLQEGMPASSDDESDGAAEEQRVLNEARFGLRPREIALHTATGSKKRKADASDFGDDARDDDLTQQASRSLASTLNTLEQKTNSRKRRAAPLADELDDAEDSDGELRRGLDMMEETLGKDFDKDSDEDAATEQYDAELDGEDDDGFYAQIAKKSKSKKDFKKHLYKVAPKFPRMEAEIEGERVVSRAILKNRGLVAHKSKLNRNPRVKKREQYRKALIRRKGAVRTLRTDEGHQYGGEATGIKSGISRSRKLANL